MIYHDILEGRGIGASSQTAGLLMYSKQRNNPAIIPERVTNSWKIATSPEREKKGILASPLCTCYIPLEYRAWEWGVALFSITTKYDKPKTIYLVKWSSVTKMAPASTQDVVTAANHHRCNNDNTFIIQKEIVQGGWLRYSFPSWTYRYNRGFYIACNWKQQAYHHLEWKTEWSVDPNTRKSILSQNLTFF